MNSLCTSPKLKICQVCQRKAHGKPFGAVTCRACAAFFRRFGFSNNCRPCKENNDCGYLPNKGWFPCKRCRLQRCWDVGMISDYSQHKLIQKVPKSVGAFLGRLNLIIFSAQNNEFGDGLNCYIDFHYVLDRAAGILDHGSETPLRSKNSLAKLATGLQNLSKKSSESVIVIEKFGKDEMLGLWENDILKIAKWLTYFDEFQHLSSEMKMTILRGIWKIWTKLEKLATEAKYGKNSDLLLGIMQITEIDTSWCSRFTMQQLSSLIRKKTR
ncbi:hypothetical protein CRE_09224 [Caenorhabditis remanei]|uniref:Nuclear receptor domain-containing protein n=1 Tax=Caenorhabditis remanei TaxID=31234 RepID=E3LHL3_CAERE|nr:hypothetical protein CRE_09224 [Caenorhabditis remanei]